MRRCIEGSLPDLYDRLLRLEYCPTLLHPEEIDSTNRKKYAAAASVAAATAAWKQEQDRTTGENGSGLSGDDSSGISDGSEESGEDSESESDSFAGFLTTAPQSKKSTRKKRQ